LFQSQIKVGLLRTTDRRTNVKKFPNAFLRNEEGLTIVEYAVAAGLITAAVVASFTLLGGTVDGILQFLIANM
jgi:pilus assembly protein Flp/PilA